MLEYCYSLPGYLEGKILSDSEITITPAERLLLRAYIPGITDDSQSERVDLALHHHEGPSAVGESCLRRVFDSVHVTDQWKGKLSEDVPHLLYSMTRELLLNRGLYSVHSACVGPDSNNQTLLVGHSGSGKTTMALDLASRYGWQIASGNKTLVEFNAGGELLVRAGTSTMTVRQSDQDAFSELVGDQQHAYGKRFAFSVDEEHFTHNAQIRVGSIVIVKLSDSFRECTKIPFPSSLHTLYPFFLDSVNADTVVADGRGVFNARSGPHIAFHLATSLSKTLKTVPVYSISGPRQYIADTVSSL